MGVQERTFRHALDDLPQRRIRDFRASQGEHFAGEATIVLVPNCSHLLLTNVLDDPVCVVTIGRQTFSEPRICNHLVVGSLANFSFA